MEDFLDNLYEECLLAMERKDLVIPRPQIDSLREELEKLKIIVNDDDFDSEFGTPLMREQWERYLQLVMMFERHDMGMRLLDKIASAWRDNFFKSVMQEVEFNETIIRNILTTSIGEIYHQFNQ